MAATEYDIHIKGGTIVDGTRVPRYRGDVWIKDGKIAQLGGRAPGGAQPGDRRGRRHRVPPASSTSTPTTTPRSAGTRGARSPAGTASPRSCWATAASASPRCKPDFRERSMLTMVRTEAIPYRGDEGGLPPPLGLGDDPRVPRLARRRPKGVNCIQYMPTASLMTYVMGLEAAKTRPATNAERKEMQRLLHEGMDAGLCGFSIQRLGPDSVQSDFDGTPDGHRHHGRRGHLRAWPRCCASATRASSRSRRRPAGSRATRDDLDFQARLAEVAQRPILHNVVSASPVNPTIHRKRLAWLAECQAQRPAGVRPGRHDPVPASPSRWRTGTSTTPARPGARRPSATPSRAAGPHGRPGAARADQGGDRLGVAPVHPGPGRRRRPAPQAGRHRRRRPGGPRAVRRAGRWRTSPATRTATTST